jgi:hypothetical protein
MAGKLMFFIPWCSCQRAELVAEKAAVAGERRAVASEAEALQQLKVGLLLALRSYNNL